MKTSAKLGKLSKPAKPLPRPAKPAGTVATKRPVFVAKVFRSGNSQAIRIPADVPLTSKSYVIEFNDNGGVTLIDPDFEARRLKALRSLWGSAPDFPDHTT
jgi:virulence-associated protein VagC